MKAGADIAKKTFDITLIDQQGQKYYGQFSNDQAGFEKLQKWLKQHQVKALHICMEATNIYWEALAEYLYEQGYQVSVVNPARIKGFAISQLRRNKTDKLDSEVIAQFCQVMQPALWTPPTPQQRKLRALVRHVKGLKKTLTQQKNRLHDAQEEMVRASLQTLIKTLQDQIAALEREIQTFILNDPLLKRRYRLLLSIKGLGPQSAFLILAEMYDLADYKNARAAAADAGLTPSHHQSGASVRRRSKLSKMGKAAVRGGLYWPAIVAMTHNPVIRALKERLEAKGKPKMVIIGAAMRKLLHLAFGVLKNDLPFDPNYVN